MSAATIKIWPSAEKLAISHGGSPMVVDLGVGLPRSGRWLWSFDRSLRRTDSVEAAGRDQRGSYESLVLTYADEQGPLIRQSLKTYHQESYLIVETTALRGLTGTSLVDSFFHTTFNSPVLLMAEGLSFLTYTWGLEGGEGVAIGGYFPDAAIAPDLVSLPEQLRLAGFSPSEDIHQTSDKPFAPLIAYDHQERTLVMSPMDHFLISPLRLIDTPAGRGITRGLHGAVDFIPGGTRTRTLLVFGSGLVPTLLKWGDLLLEGSGEGSGQGRAKGKDHTLVKSLGFWNCYGSYYAELFRQTNAETLNSLSDYFRQTEIPVRYVGLDLWYSFQRVGFARSYQPDADKYPQGLKKVMQDTGLPALLHMSAFDRETEYRDSYQFVSEEGSAYPAHRDFYQDRAREFRSWGALGIWPDFLRTQLQNSRSLRDRIGTADQWFADLCQAMGQEDLAIMLCMPTVGHYLASTAEENVIAVRTSTDYVNHQAGQLQILSRNIEEYRLPNTSDQNLRQNLMLSLLAGALGLAPSYDVFITNRKHPEGFAEPEAAKQSLARALSAGVVGIGDRAGCVDRSIIEKLVFADGTLSQPDHPPFPVVSTLQSNVPAFYTTTQIGDLRWIYVAWFNLAGTVQQYDIQLDHLFAGLSETAYDYFSGQLLANRNYQGSLQGGEYRYLVIPPGIGGLHPLGFLEKYVTVSRRQVKAVISSQEGVAFDLEIPAGRAYTFAVVVDGGIKAAGPGISQATVENQGGLTLVRFTVDAEPCRLILSYE